MRWSIYIVFVNQTKPNDVVYLSPQTACACENVDKKLKLCDDNVRQAKLVVSNRTHAR